MTEREPSTETPLIVLSSSADGQRRLCYELEDEGITFLRQFQKSGEWRNAVVFTVGKQDARLLLNSLQAFLGDPKEATGR